MSSSMLLSLSSKLTLRKIALRSSTNTLGIRMVSSCSSTLNNVPYLLYRVERSSSEDTDASRNIHYFDPVKEDEVIVQEKVFPRELEQGCLSGMSHGYGVFSVDLGEDKDKPVYVTDYLSPWSSKTNPKIIPLYPAWAIKGSQVDLMSNAAMTCSPDQRKDFAVAVNCLGSQINFYRPGGDLNNSDLVMKTTPYRFFEQSKIMYSKRDQRFYIPGFGGHFLGSWDAFFENRTIDTVHDALRFFNLPQLTHSEWELLDSCSNTVQLVESPSGQRFLIKWYALDQPGKKITFLCRGTKRFMVFREEEEMNMCYTYTEDIGDLCIFLGNNEPFCLKASSFPGLNPNSIYFAGDGFGVYDIATRKPRSFRPKPLSAFSEPPTFPYWIPPLSL